MSGALLPDRLATLADVLPLPSREQMSFLARHELLSAFLKRRLLEALADEAQGAEPTSDDLAGLAQRLGYEKETDLENWRKRFDIDLDSLRALAAFPRRLSKATEDLWGEGVPSQFLERRPDLDQVVLSLVRFADPDLAQELYFQLKEGELSFGELVERHASGPDQLRRGLLGPILLRRLHPLLAKVVERYPEKALIPPIDLDGTVHLIRVEEILKAELNDSLRQQLLVEQRNRWLAEQMRRLQLRILDVAATVGEDPVL